MNGIEEISDSKYRCSASKQVRKSKGWCSGKLKQLAPKNAFE